MALVDPLTVAIVAGLLGGGVAGAVVGGLISLQTQRRTFDHERQTRFIELKRDRYAALLRASDEWIRAQWHQMDVTKAADADRRSRYEIPELLPTQPVKLLAEEIELLAPPHVGLEANLLADAIHILTGFDEHDPEELARMRSVARYAEVSAEYTLRRNRFVRLAKEDLGTG
jgi:hypothetical protein